MVEFSGKCRRAQFCSLQAVASNQGYNSAELGNGSRLSENGYVHITQLFDVNINASQKPQNPFRAVATLVNLREVCTDRKMFNQMPNTQLFQMVRPNQLWVFYSNLSPGMLSVPPADSETA